MKQHKHKWMVYSTALCPPSLMVKCSCGRSGYAKKVGSDNWAKAYYAPRQSYPLNRDLVSKVIIFKEK